MKRSEFIKVLGRGATVYSLIPVHKGFARSLASSMLVKNHDWLRISGVYPHLAVFNQGGEKLCKGAGGECGIGAVVPWAGKLWLITYSPHCPKGSADKLYSIDSDLNLTIQPESVGGTPADRMIHKESNQLIIGPYFIDSNKNIRVIQPEKMPGRLTAVARHLKDPANMVYFYDMEGKLYEANVHTLESTLLFVKPVPGWHGKGAYTAEGRLVLANNGDAENKTFDIKPDTLEIGSTSQNEEQKGVLAEWDGGNWSIVRRRQFTEITGPGGIYGSPNDKSPAWSLGWDRRSVILMLLDHGKWTEFRLPKSTHTYDSPNGWYTEWTRIREVTGNKFMMDMHGMLYEFPQKFSLEHIGGIRPLCNHLLMITDFCEWKGEIVLSTDETTMMANKLPGQSQSNLWFGSWNDLSSWGPSNCWGGVWQNDAVKAGISSNPYLIGGFDKKIVHLAHQSEIPVTFTFEIFKTGHWEIYKNITVGPNAYEFYIFPSSFEADWIKVKTDNDCEATVYFHYFTRGHEANQNEKIFDSIARIEDKEYDGGLVRPANYNRHLQYLDLTEKNKHNPEGKYYEIDEKIQFLEPEDKKNKEVAEICAIEKDFEIDDASVVVKDKSGTYRLPKTNAIYDQPFETGWPRGRREVITERSLLNVHGTIYEIANQSGMATMRPICTHLKRIIDFCSWRGLMVISGTKSDAGNDGNYFSPKKNSAGLWFGSVDDIWKLGQPVGHGGPWKNTKVKAGEYSLSYLMTGYDKKEVELSSNKDVTISLEVDFDHNGWHLYKTFDVAAGRTVVHQFPDGYSAHWIRAMADKDTKASVQFLYG
ncbi:MAG TPA: hypothetical protein VFI29_13305 [Hanamia sp.]|nr:hypothetical protein [Hanamia sp.]